MFAYKFTAVLIPTVQEQIDAGTTIVDPASVTMPDPCPAEHGGTASNFRLVDGRLVADFEYHLDPAEIVARPWKGR